MNLPVASFSLINKWENCRYQTARMYLPAQLGIPSLPREPDNKAQQEGNEIHDAFARRIRDKIPFPEKMQAYEKWTRPLDMYHIEPEMRVSILSDGTVHNGYDGAWLFTKIDCPIIGDDEQTAMLMDWKSGANVREEPLELYVQALCLKAKYPKLQKITGHYVWLKYDRLGLPHDCSNVARTWHIVNTHMRNIDDAMRLNEFPKNPGPLCKWCPVKDCEHNKAPK